ncbi:hypothetical protein ABBQ38_008389 [Trebouxia sp. C0009 RCD-2024]
MKMDHARRLKQMRHSLEDEKRKRSEDSARLRRQLELKQRVIQERRAFLSELFVYHRDVMRPVGQKALRSRAARNTHIKAFHRRQGDKVAREQNARIAALKENNYEEYLKLAANTKNQRLRTLLEKTGSIISELGLKVHDQRSAVTEEEELANHVWLDGRVPPQQGSDLEPEARHMIQSQRQYYDEVHVIKEQVEAPGMLVGGTLRHYQLGGLKFLMSLYNNNMNGILADEMGLGKTIQTISFLASLMEKKDNMGPHIILAPKKKEKKDSSSAVELPQAVLSNWGQEFAKWAPDMAVVMYDGSPDERKQLQRDRVEKGTFNVLVTHYDLVMRDKAALRKVQWDLLIVDEGHRLKNAESRLAEILRSYRFKHRVLLTGTPIQNSLGELWSLLNFVLPRVFNSSETFDEWFAAPFRGQSEAVSEQLNEEEQLLVISRLHQGRIRGDDKTMRSLQNTAMHLRKTCNHPYLFLPPSYIPTDPQELIKASGKLELLDRILPKLQATGHRVLLFSQMTRALDMVEDFLQLRSLKYLRLDGKTKSDARASMLINFNKEDSEYFIFALSTRAGGLGLNLQTADTVIMFDSDWNPQMDQQVDSRPSPFTHLAGFWGMVTQIDVDTLAYALLLSTVSPQGVHVVLTHHHRKSCSSSTVPPTLWAVAEDRAHRIGQKKEVLVLVLVSAGTIEQVILDRAQQKKEIEAKVIQAGMFNDKSTHNERQEALQTAMRRGGMDGGAQVHTPPQLNKLLARSTEEFKIFQQMDEDREAATGAISHLMTDDEVPAWVTQDAASEQSQQEELEDEGEGRRPKRRSSNAGLHYSEDLSDAMFDRLLQTDEQPGSASEEDVVMPARRLSKSRTATPAVSDSEEAPEAAAAADAQEEAAANKGKLRKATPDQQDTGPPKKRRKRSSSKTPEASEGAEASAAPDGQGQEKPVSEGSKDPSKQKPSSGGASSSGQKRGRPPQQGGSKEGKATLKPPKPGKSPVPKGQKTSGQKKAKEAGQTHAASTESPGAGESQSKVPQESKRGSRTRSPQE